MERNASRRVPAKRSVDVLAATVAGALGTSRRAAAIALWGPMNLAHRCARVIAALRAAGADETLVRFIQPIDLAIHAAQPAALTDDERVADPVLHDSTGLPPREIAQAFLNRIYEDLELRAVLRRAPVARYGML